MLIGSSLFLVAGLFVPSIFYYLACHLADKRRLKIYLVSCLTITAIAFIYPGETSLISKINSSDGLSKVPFLLILLLISTSFIGGMVGTISKMLLLKIEQDKIDSIEAWQVHAVSLCLMVFVSFFVYIAIVIVFS